MRDSILLIAEALCMVLTLCVESDARCCLIPLGSENWGGFDWLFYFAPEAVYQEALRRGLSIYALKVLYSRIRDPRPRIVPRAPPSSPTNIDETPKASLSLEWARDPVLTPHALVDALEGLNIVPKSSEVREEACHNNKSLT